jgi:hypothetical protein
LFGDGVKPGDTITMKVAAVYGDEVEVLATAESADEPEMEDEQPPVITADQEIETAAEQA